MSFLGFLRCLLGGFFTFAAILSWTDGLITTAKADLFPFGALLGEVLLVDLQAHLEVLEAHQSPWIDSLLFPFNFPTM